MSRAKKTIQEQNTKPDAIQNQVVDKLEADIAEIVEQYIQTLDDPTELKENNGLFVDMLKYIYKHYIRFILDNDTNKGANRYDYKLLDNLFNIYTELVYRYKKNKRPLISEYCLFTHISDETLYNIRYCRNDKATLEDRENVKRWYKECETALANGGSVFEIFLLKSCYGFNDNLAPIPIEAQGATLSIQQLPDLTKNDSRKVLEDKSKTPENP